MGTQQTPRGQRKARLRQKRFQFKCDRRNAEMDRLSGGARTLDLRPEVESMPFGKFKERPFAEVPTWYLAWVLTLDDIDDRLVAAIGRVLAERASRLD